MHDHDLPCTADYLRSAIKMVRTQKCTGVQCSSDCMLFRTANGCSANADENWVLSMNDVITLTKYIETFTQEELLEMLL